MIFVSPDTFAKHSELLTKMDRVVVARVLPSDDAVFLPGDMDIEKVAKLLGAKHIVQPVVDTPSGKKACRSEFCRVMICLQGGETSLAISYPAFCDEVMTYIKAYVASDAKAGQSRKLEFLHDVTFMPLEPMTPDAEGTGLTFYATAFRVIWDRK